MSYLPTEDVVSLGQINFQGNVIPPTWFKEITKPNGLPDVNAILLLSEIVYWYRPIRIRDEQTGEEKFYRRFHSDILQKSYDQLTSSIGLSYKQLKEGFINLERLGIAKREFRNLETEMGPISNVMFVRINPERIADITNKELKKFMRSVPNGKGVVPNREGGGSQSGNTYTETTTKTTPKTSNENVLKTLSSEKNKNKKVDIQRRWKLSDSQMDSFNWLKGMNIPTEDNQIAYWAKTHTLERLQDVYYEAKSMEPEHLGRYICSLLKKNAIVKNSNAEKNREFAEIFKETNSIKEMKIQDKFVKIPYKGRLEDISLNMDCENFVNKLIELYEIGNE